MNIHYCWITALIPQYQDGIIAGMAKKGYMIGPASKDGKLVSMGKDSPSALISISVYSASVIEISKLFEDLTSVLQEMKALYHSIIIAASYEATWVGSNIHIESKLENDPSFLPPGDRSKLN
jgi:hypothetical protein